MFNIHESDKDDEEWKDIITNANKESRENDLECLEDARQRKIFRLNKIDSVPK